MRLARASFPPLIACAAVLIVLLYADAASPSTADYRFLEFCIDTEGGGPPDIDGDEVGWTHGGFLRGYNLARKEYWARFSENVFALGPKISGEWVVWADNAASPLRFDYSIIAKNIETGEARHLITGARSQLSSYAIDGKYVAWSDSHDHLWLYDISTDFSVLITDTGHNSAPVMDGP